METIKPKQPHEIYHPPALALCKRQSHNSAVPHNILLNVISSHAEGSQTGTTWQLSKKDELQFIVNPSVWSQFESTAESV